MVLVQVNLAIVFGSLARQEDVAVLGRQEL